jgi:murein L,D-transpeptidase YcbB/YkuD
VALNQRERGFKSNRIPVSLLVLVAFTGWGAYAHSLFESADLEKQLHGQTATLRGYQTQLAQEGKKVEEGAKRLEEIRVQLSDAQTEIQRLTVKTGEVDAELAKARDQLAASQQIIQPYGVGSAPELLRIKPRPTKQDVMAAQQALTQLRFGDLKADGVIGSSTRKAVEEFQRTVGLPATGELYAQTLLALIRSAKVVAAQNERVEQPL